MRSLAAGVAVLAILTVLFIVNPSQTNWLPGCFLHKLTGLHCPGCGATRAVHHLLHGDFVAAFLNNPLAVLALPVGTALWLWKRQTNYPTPRSVIWGLVIVAVLFGILRNIPHPPFAMLAP